jgi:hypothetical protein
MRWQHRIAPESMLDLLYERSQRVSERPQNKCRSEWEVKWVLRKETFQGDFRDFQNAAQRGSKPSVERRGSLKGGKTRLDGLQLWTTKDMRIMWDTGAEDVSLGKQRPQVSESSRRLVETLRALPYKI